MGLETLPTNEGGREKVKIEAVKKLEDLTKWIEEKYENPEEQKFRGEQLRREELVLGKYPDSDVKRTINHSRELGMFLAAELVKGNRVFARKIIESTFGH